MKRKIYLAVGSLFLNLFATATFAADAAPSDAGSSAIAQGAMLAAFALIFYFLILRPQSKRAKEHRALITGLQKGDEILTSGGLLGKVSKIADDFIMVTVADNIDVAIQRQAVAAVLPKGTLKAI
jgi:preprotein translocase subunit YajC